jgi:hypothetical protein
MQLRVKRMVPGKMVNGRFVRTRKNPLPAGEILLAPFSLATPAGLDKRGRLRKNPALGSDWKSAKVRRTPSGNVEVLILETA